MAPAAADSSAVTSDSSGSRSSDGSCAPRLADAEQRAVGDERRERAYLRQQVGGGGGDQARHHAGGAAVGVEGRRRARLVGRKRREAVPASPVAVDIDETRQDHVARFRRSGAIGGRRDRGDDARPHGHDAIG
jgi:hypothetical protein